MKGPGAVTGSLHSLSPKTSRWDTTRRRRGYEGSSITADSGRLTFTPPHGKAAQGWDLVIGSGSGQASRVVHVYGLIVLPSGRGPGYYIDWYAVLDSAGRFLARFPSGADEPSGSEGTEADANDAWYPAKDVADLVSGAGMSFSQDQVDTPQEVANRYPGLLEHQRYWAVLTYANTVIYLPSGLYFIVSQFLYPPHLGDDPIVWFARFMALFGGAFFVFTGVACFPPILRRRRLRDKAKHPESSAPRNRP
jgi:hypothetical protein